MTSCDERDVDKNKDDGLLEHDFLPSDRPAVLVESDKDKMHLERSHLGSGLSLRLILQSLGGSSALDYVLCP